MDEERRREIGLWRVSVLGPLVSAELEHGDVRQLCEAQARRWYKAPNGRRVQLSWRTIEGWYYLYRQQGRAGLEPTERSDVGLSRAIDPELEEEILVLKRERPRRSIRMLIRTLERAGKVPKDTLSRSTVHRLLVAHGLSRRPTRAQEKERRAYRHMFANDCWLADVMHGPLVRTEDGGLHKAYLHGFLDSATRYVVGGRFCLGERAADFESVLRDALQTRGLSRQLYLDNGAAQIADSLAAICAELGIHLTHAAPRDAAAKGGIERFFKTVRAEFCDELPDEPLTLAELNALFWAWLSREYHRREHEGTGRIPFEHWMEQADRLRPAPSPERLREIFLHRQRRKVRQDNTVRYHSVWLEVPGNHAGDWVELRFDPSTPFDPARAETLPRIFYKSQFVGDPKVLDVHRNADGRRHRTKAEVAPPAKPSGLVPLAQLADEQARITQPLAAVANRRREDDPEED